MMAEEPTAPGSTAPSEAPPRKRAAGPRFDALPEFRAPPPPPVAPPRPQYPSDSLERIASVKEPRIGPFFVKYSIWGGGAAIAYTYLVGFRALYQKDRPTWLNTFRQRIFIMSPLIAMYMTGANLLPMPFRSSLEALLGRPAITIVDIDRAERKAKAERKAAAQEAQQQADSRADEERLDRT